MSQTFSPWLIFLVDFSLRAVLLAVAAAMALKLLRVSDPSIRHRVWSGVVAGMLALPVLAWLLPAIPLPLPRTWISAPAIAQVDRTAARERRATDNLLSTTRSIPAEQPVPATSTIMPSGQQQRFDAQAEPRQNSRQLAEPQSVALSGGGVTTAAPSQSIDYSRLASNSLLCIWMVVSVGFAMRLLTGLWASSRLRRRCMVIDEQQMKAALCELSPQLTRRRVTICESGEVATPVTMGWIRPSVLLPLEWRTWSDEKLKAIVAHEVAHVDRRDFFVTCVAELNRSLYWFHPVSWWLRRRLSDLAEEACDDAAISLTGDRTGYARHLLEVAESLARQRGRRVQPALSMASKPQVESRIQSILDMTRPLSSGLSWRSAALITLVAAPLIGAAAALTPLLAEETPEPTKPIETATNPASSKPADTPDESRGHHIHGRVIDDAGNPVAEATVRLYRSVKSDWYAAPNHTELLGQWKVDQQGRFDDWVQDLQIEEKDYRKRLDLVVSAPGFGIATARGNPGTPVIDGKPVKRANFLSESIEIQLRPTVSLGGRLISIEGQPVEGAKVTVYQVSQSDPARLEAWIAQAAKKPPAHSEMQQRMMFGGQPKQGTLFPTRSEMPLPAECVAPVVTDAAGNFELSGVVAEDDLAVLRIEGDGITNRTLHVLARDMKPVYGRHTINFSFTGAYYGRQFDYVTQPSVPIFGIVRDIETKAPLADIPVAVGRIYGSTMSNTGYMLTRTDDQGRYRIEGLPIPPEGTRKYDRNNLAIRPGNLPYIESDHIPIPRGNGVDPVEFNVGLRRAVIAKGRITNIQTGEPIVAEMYFAPFATNDLAKNYRTYSSGVTTMLGNDTRYHSNEEGYFEIPVVPGRGVIAARVRAGGYITSYGADAISEFSTKDGKNGGFGATLGGHIVPTLYHSMKEIDVAPDAKEIEVAMQVDPGHSVTIKFVDPDGQPVSDVGGSGLTTDRRWRTTEESFAKATSLAIGETRPLHFKSEPRNLARFVRLIPEKGQTEFDVTLYPHSRLVGRIVDPQGRPMPDVRLDARHQNDPSFMGSLPPMNTDSEGRFEFDLVVGTKYNVIAVTENHYTVVRDLENDRPQHIDVGDMVLEPTAERWSDLKSKREPIISELDATAPEKAETDSP